MAWIQHLGKCSTAHFRENRGMIRAVGSERLSARRAPRALSRHEDG
jgi:hypothetical protein